MDPGIDADVAAKLHSFVEQSSDVIGLADPWGRILYLNPAACKRVGVADYSGLTLADLFPTEVFSYYYEVVRPELLRALKDAGYRGLDAREIVELQNSGVGAGSLREAKQYGPNLTIKQVIRLKQAGVI